MASRDSIDPNNLPGQPHPRGSRRGMIILWLVAISCVVLIIPLYLVSVTVRSDTTRLEADFQAIQNALIATPTLEPEAQALVDELAQVRGMIAEIEKAQSAIAADQTDWPAVMTAIGDYDSSQVTLTSLTLEGKRITLGGQAADDTVVVAYSRSLEESGLFSRVVVQSLKTVASPFATPTRIGIETPGAPLTPTATVTPTMTPAPTPSQSDEYEVDDFQAKPIFLGQLQRHNFYPIYDVDRCKFLAKAGRYYRVSTSDLTPGVDTFLTVNLGGTAYTNDDREPGDLSSEIVFQVGAGQDMETRVTVTNRGEYGPDSWYQIAVEEVAPTPTSLPTPSPTHTPTPVPTDTPIPEDTPTPTPDLRDGYEPDDDSPRPIAIEETQKHNFYPANDVDKVEFLAKAGRYYRVSTSVLATGVDTVLTVSLGEAIYINDDREPGDLSSEIVLQAEAGFDIEAFVEVTNRRQYGPEMWYHVTVEEIVPTPTPTEVSSSRLPGVASLISSKSKITPRGLTNPCFWPVSGNPGRAELDLPSLALCDCPLSLRTTGGQAGIIPPPSISRNGKSLNVPHSEAVEFVIVLELK